jgi:hypothetical protein
MNNQIGFVADGMATLLQIEHFLGVCTSTPKRPTTSSAHDRYLDTLASFASCFIGSDVPGGFAERALDFGDQAMD